MPAREFVILTKYSRSGGSDEPAHPHKLTRTATLPGGGGGGGGTLILSHIRRLGPFFWVQNSEFQYFFGFSEK